MRSYRYILVLGLLSILAGCSSTRSIPEGDQLFTGVKSIDYVVKDKGPHFAATQEELDAALATAPNGALFGSSNIRSPFPVGLWIWNALAGTKSPVGKWVLKTFGSKPILMSWVNPELRASVAEQVLKAHGYFRGTVQSEVIPQKNSKEAKIKYVVDMGHLFRIDTLSYANFTPAADSLINATKDKALVTAQSPFDVSALEGERARINTLFRNNGYYYYQPAYASYLADTVNVPGKVLLKFQQINNLPGKAKRKWHIGRIDVDLHRTFGDSLHDSLPGKQFTIRYNGRRTPLRSSFIQNALKLKPQQMYTYADQEESLRRLSASGLFNMVSFSFAPRDTMGINDTLDVKVNCLFDKKYDFFVEANLTGKTSNRFGPGAVVGLTKRNAFRAGEKLELNFRGSYEWQTGHQAEGTKTGFNSYQYGFDMSLQYPRLMIPFIDFFSRKLIHRYSLRHFYSIPTTTFKVSSDIISRAGYFKRHVVSGEWTYNIETSATSRHQFSPLIFSFEYMRSSTSAFDSIMRVSPYLFYTMRNQFVPKMQYIYTYTSPSHFRSPLWWQTSVSEAGNLISLGYMIAGHKWNQKDKKMFHNPYAQFFKLETELVKTWRLTEHSTLVAHGDIGAIWSYGNSSGAPYSEQFFVGGANSIRAYTARFIGPGSYHNAESANIYFLDQTGDIKVLANLEYRPRLIGNLYGAVFIDGGNVWSMHHDYRTGGTFSFKRLPQELAVGTGLGIRYDLDFLVIRLDWGVGLHVPYKPGFINVGNLKDNQSLHFAIGYPF